MKLITSFFVIIFSYLSLASNDVDAFKTVNGFDVKIQSESLEVRDQDQNTLKATKQAKGFKGKDHLVQKFTKNAKRYKSILKVKKFWRNQEPYFALQLKLFQIKKRSESLIHVTETLIIDPQVRRTSGSLGHNLSFENLSLDDFQKITYSFQTFGDSTAVTFTYQ